MKLRHLAAATDGSAAGHHAVVVAARLARHASARLSVLTVRVAPQASATTGPSGVDPAHQSLRRDLAGGFAAELRTEAPGLDPEFVVRTGVPGIEIPRFAEEHAVDLLVLGRTRRSPTQRVFFGDTADAVARRSHVPCLLVSPETSELTPVLACLDATVRSEAVSRVVADFARIAGSRLEAVTVEPVWLNEPDELAAALPAARTLRLNRALVKSPSAPELHIRRGDVVTELLAEAAETGARLLAFGYRRGGPPGIVEGGSVARRLLHTAPSAVLTVPL